MPEKTVREHLYDAIDLPKYYWKDLAPNRYKKKKAQLPVEEATPMEEAMDDPFIAAGSDSGIDMSRGASSETNRAEGPMMDGKSGTRKEAQGTKRGRDSSASSPGEDEVTDEPRRKKERSKSPTGEAIDKASKTELHDPSRDGFDQRIARICSESLGEIARMKKGLQVEIALDEEDLDEIQKDLDEGEKFSADQEKAYKEKESVLVGCENEVEEIRDLIEVLEKRKGSKSIVKLIAQARADEKELVAEVKTAGLAARQQEAQRDQAREKVKTALGDVENAKKKVNDKKAMSEGLEERVSMFEAACREMQEVLGRKWSKGVSG